MAEDDDRSVRRSDPKKRSSLVGRARISGSEARSMSETSESRHDKGDMVDKELDVMELNLNKPR